MSLKDWDVDDAKFQLFLSERSNDFNGIIEEAERALRAWQESESLSARTVLLFWMQTSPIVSEAIFDHIVRDLHNNQNLQTSMSLLEHCSKPCSNQTAIVDAVWSILGATESAEVSESCAHTLTMLLPSYVRTTNSLPFGAWWSSLLGAMTITKNRKHTSAALRAWLACLSQLDDQLEDRSGIDKTELVDVMTRQTDRYFGLLQFHVAKANKLALRILAKSLALIESPIIGDGMSFDPKVQGVRDAWTRYISLIEILGIDTSIHQTEDSLSDFAALLSQSSPIPPEWLKSLVNVGLCQSNTEGIRVLTMHLIMGLEKTQLYTLARFPSYLARTIYPRILQTPNFVILSGRCLQAEHLQKFTQNMMNALIDTGIESLRAFVFDFSQYLLEHAHSFEAPRALFAESLLKVLPPDSLGPRESRGLLAAAHATVLTYNSKAMADLYLDLIKEVVASAGPKIMVHELNDSKSALGDDASSEWEANGRLEETTLYKLKKASATFTPPDHRYQDMEGTSTLLEILPDLELAWLNSNQIDSKALKKLVTAELQNPKPLSCDERKRLSLTFRIACDILDFVDYDTCEQIFTAFSEFETRFAALSSFKRGDPKNISLEQASVLWSHIKDATLRIVDRELHLLFVDMLTKPGFIRDSQPPFEICSEIVELSVLKRNLLYPLTKGLARFRELLNPPAWVFVIMCRVFAFVQSKEYTVRLEEMVGRRFGIFEKYWGPPESHARAVAIMFLYQCSSAQNSFAYDSAIHDTLEVAQLQREITGSLDNLEAHRRVLYYQLLTILQRASSKAAALEALSQVKASLESEANPPVRIQGEWLICAIGATHLASSAAEATEFLSENLKDLEVKNSPPRVLGSTIRACLLLYYSCLKRKVVDESTFEKMGEALALQLVPLATSNKAVVRHRAISALYIMDRKQMSPDILKSVIHNIANLNEGGVKNSSLANESFLWDVLDLRLGQVCGGICSTLFDRKMPNTLLLSDFGNISSEDLEAVGSCWSDELVVKLNRQKAPEFPDVITYREKIVQEAISAGASEDFSRHIQTKSGTFDKEHHLRRTSLIVVATLCDKPVNLGAITRLSDALGASKLVLRDLTIVGNAQFKSTALSAEKWIPLEQVAEDSLCIYLREQKAKGYTLVGIEQTDTSKKLSASLQFPENTLLIMGHERQGIPAELLAILDACVEIEQLGYVRSMNIQTATAVVVQAYNQNHSPDVKRVEYSIS